MKTNILFFVFTGLLLFFHSCNNPNTVEKPIKKITTKKKTHKGEYKKEKRKRKFSKNFN